MGYQRGYPQLMVFDEKHDKEIYIVQSKEDEIRIAVMKLRERASMGYYETDPSQFEAAMEKGITELIDRCELDPKSAPRTVEALNALQSQGSKVDQVASAMGIPTEVFENFPAPMRERALRNYESFIAKLPRRISGYLQEIEDARDFELLLKSEGAEKLTKTHRGREHSLALWLLDSRRDGEYEGYDLESPMAVPSEADLEAARKDFL